MPSKVLWSLAATFFVILVGAAAYKGRALLFPGGRAGAPLDPHCDLRRGPCTSSLPGGGVLTFEITPHDIPLVQPLELKVETRGVSATAAEVDFSGVEMYMGFNRPTLQAQAQNRFSGSGILPVCTRNRMEWEARVLLDTADGRLAAPFRFWTFNPGSEPNDPMD